MAAAPPPRHEDRHTEWQRGRGTVLLPSLRINRVAGLFTGVPLHNRQPEMLCWPLQPDGFEERSRMTDEQIETLRRHGEILEYYDNLHRLLWRSTQNTPLEKANKPNLADSQDLAFGISHQFITHDTRSPTGILCAPRLKLHYTWQAACTITLNFVFTDEHAMAILTEGAYDLQHADVDSVSDQEALNRVNSPDLVVLIGNDGKNRQFNPYNAAHFLVHAVYTPWSREGVATLLGHSSSHSHTQTLADFLNVDDLFDVINSNEALRRYATMTNAILWMLTCASTCEMRLETGSLLRLMRSPELFYFPGDNGARFQHFGLDANTLDDKPTGALRMAWRNSALMSIWDDRALLQRKARQSYLESRRYFPTLLRGGIPHRTTPGPMPGTTARGKWDARKVALENARNLRQNRGQNQQQQFPQPYDPTRGNNQPYPQYPNPQYPNQQPLQQRNAKQQRNPKQNPYMRSSGHSDIKVGAREYQEALLELYQGHNDHQIWRTSDKDGRDRRRLAGSGKVAQLLPGGVRRVIWGGPAKEERAATDYSRRKRAMKDETQLPPYQPQAGGNDNYPFPGPNNPYTGHQNQNPGYYPSPGHPNTGYPNTGNQNQNQNMNFQNNPMFGNPLFTQPQGGHQQGQPQSQQPAYYVDEHGRVYGNV